MASAQDVRGMFKRFRILVVGRAMAGKTTLLQKVCNATEKPEIFDGHGNKISADVVRGSTDRGYHDINNELVFRSSPGFVFHDSCGFEAGGEDEFQTMKKFISERASARILDQRVHAIWYCIPMDEYHRAITTAEERFFSECDTSNVPVIAVFTKFDALSAVALGDLRRTPGLTRKDVYERTPERAEEIFANANIWGRLCTTRHPPKDYIRLARMNIDETDCGPLLERTMGALDDEALQMLLTSTQRMNLELCITFAVKKVVMAYIKRACQGSLQVSEEECILMQKDIAKWFPHTGDQLHSVDQMIMCKMVFDSSFIPPESSAIAQIIYIAIATTIVLEYSFFSLQMVEQTSAKIAELVASEYIASQTPIAIKQAVEELLHQHHDEHGGDEKLCEMIIDEILKKRMPLAGVQDNGDLSRTHQTLLKQSHSNPHLSDQKVLNEGSHRGSISLVHEAEFSLNTPNHEPTFISSSAWNPISNQTDLAMTSNSQPILKPIKPQDGLAPSLSDPDDTYLSISMHPTRDFGLVVDDSDEFTASLRPLMKCMEGGHFDLQGISSFFSSPDPNLQCAALQMLEHAAEWESTNFTEYMPVTFGPVSELLDSKNLQVHCAALDILKLFLASPHAVDIIQTLIPHVASAVLNDLSSSELLVQMCSVELLEAAAQSEEILVQFAAAISHISSVLPSMPTTTQVAALGVLEVSAGSNSHVLVKAVADTCQSFTRALFSPETTVQIAVLEVLEAGLGAKSMELHRAVTAVLPVLADIMSSGAPDVQTVARRVLEAGTRPVALDEVDLSSTDSLLMAQPSALQHSQGQLPGQEYGPFSQATIRGAGALPGRTDTFSRQLPEFSIRNPIHVSSQTFHSALGDQEVKCTWPGCSAVIRKDTYDQHVNETHL